MLSLLLSVCPCHALAQTDSNADEPTDGRQWYTGIEGGVPFGFSTFSSFGEDKVRAGYAFGLFGGYRFNPVLSTELTLKWGKAVLSARDCCVQSGYWLGADGITYHSPVAGMNGQDYSALKSDVSLQQYGIRLNVNLLGLFKATRQSRWTLEVSPVLAAVGTKATIKTIAEDNNVMKDKTRWHLGTGGCVQTSYALTRNLSVGVYSGITWLTGRSMNGIAKNVHNANCIWESGMRVGWAFGKNTAPPALPKGEELRVTPVRIDTASITVPPKPLEREELADSIVQLSDTTLSSPAGRLGGVVYFDFNRTVIRASEVVKLQAILDLLCEYPDVHILVTGWCDPVGSRAVNDRISRQRAEAVKAWLVRHGIEAERIRTQGKGIDRNEPDRKKARRAVMEETEK